jgi:7,8-dihydropterin-6-yl-methyl-4-(beta-D-ribofuranosyl)aminobenzene 5'-phosphate synthase
MGGFHLLNDGDGDILGVIAEFNATGVRYAAASHCSGERARALFARQYGGHFIPLGTGTVIKPENLK